MVIAYVRVSTEKQHLENQRSEIIRYANARNLSVNKWIEEVVSGKTDRKIRRLGKTINSLKKGDILIVTELSRLSRSLHEIMMIMKFCVDNGVEVHSTKDGYVFDDSLNSKVLSFAFGLSAEIEHKLISQRTKEALASRKAAGKHVGRRFGTDYKYREAMSRESEIIELIEDDVSIEKICKKMGFSTYILDKMRSNNPKIDQAIKERRKISGVCLTREDES